MTMTETRPWNAPKGKGKAEPKGPTVADTIDTLAGIRAQIKELEKSDKALSDQLKIQLGDGEHYGNKCILAITTIDTERFDTKTFKSDHPEFAAKYTMPVVQTRLTFKPLV